MKKNLIFPTEIFENYLPNISNSVLLAECHNLYLKNNKGQNISNVGGWQSQSYTTGISSEINKLIYEIILNLATIFNNYNIKRTPKLINYWFNINFPHSYNISHNHTLSFFSVVYYVYAPKNSGDLILERTDDSVFYMQYFTEMNEYSAQAIIIDPSESKLIIFPSWLKHSVGQNKSNDNRVSLAFNFI